MQVKVVEDVSTSIEKKLNMLLEDGWQLYGEPLLRAHESGHSIVTQIMIKEIDNG